jgi:hypothetical protein
MMKLLKLAGAAVLLPMALSVQAVAADRQAVDAVEVTAQYTYLPLAKEPREKALSLATFGARIRAAEMGAKFLAHRGLLAHFGDRQKEILCLAADEIDATIVEERFTQRTGGCFVKIRARVQATDFVRAQIADQELEEKEKHLSYRQEMEQPVSPDISPGKDLSRAYRYLRQKQWRIAVIYLKHLQRKYPNWSEVYLAKAIGHYTLNQTDMMTEALQTACRLNNQEACDDLRGLGLEGAPATFEN